MENMTDVNATSNDQRTGVDATAGSGATVVDTMQGSSNTSTIGGTKQSLYAASSDPGVQAIRSQGCFPKEQLTPNELLPQDNSTAWAQVNPQGAGTLKDKNFLQAAHHVDRSTDIAHIKHPPADEILTLGLHSTLTHSGQKSQVGVAVAQAGDHVFSAAVNRFRGLGFALSLFDRDDLLAVDQHIL